jgi:hypothetical protein
VKAFRWHTRRSPVHVCVYRAVNICMSGSGFSMIGGAYVRGVKDRTTSGRIGPLIAACGGLMVRRRAPVVNDHQEVDDRLALTTQRHPPSAGSDALSRPVST